MLSPLLVFARRIKHPLDVSVQRPHHTNARHHGRAAELNDQEQGFDRGLPRFKILFGLPKLSRLHRAESQAPAHPVAGQDHRRDEPRRQRTLDRAISYLPSGMCRVLNWHSFPPLRLPHSPSRLLCFRELLTEFVQFGDLNKEIGRITGEN